MGYSEIPCRLCGVSFNIGRTRKPGEPPSEGWTATGDGRDFVDDSGDCDLESGCQLVFGDPTLDLGYESPERIHGEIDAGDGDEDDDPEDEDYVDEIEHRAEVYEYESDDDFVSSGSDSVDLDDDEGVRRAWIQFLRGETALDETKTEDVSMDDTFQPLGLLRDDEGRRILNANFEHIAGPNCQNERGYNGHSITVEEMQGCNISQCLINKGQLWKPEAGDQDYEREAKYYFSGLNDCMPSRDWVDYRSLPARHGLEGMTYHCDNVVWDKSNPNVAVPFHPTCFDIFTRLSRFHFGRVDVDGLMRWHFVEGADGDVYGFPHHADVRSSSEQWWQHKRGLEYLSANPLFVPKLESILFSAIHMEPSFSAQDGAFDTAESSSPSNDVFDLLPQELKWQVIGYLNSKSVANLRCASRSFHQLPISLWRRLLQQEMPWLWEVWSDDVPYYWATITIFSVRREEKYKEELERDIEVIIRSEMPEVMETWKEAKQILISIRPGSVARSRAEALEKLVCGLPPRNTNWYEVYCGITRNWKNLKGLHNRARIWKDVEEIIRRIRRYRDEGKFED